MATYKLIQDIEAEDHILGPLSLRQFIFAIIAAFGFYLSFLVVAKHVAFLVIIFLPPSFFFGFFALPFGRDQPTEVWALAKLRFWIKPRKRIWNQSGLKELVTITAPKTVEATLTDGLNLYQVQSRLNALATTLDSRGWAVKNVSSGNNPQTYMPTSFGPQSQSPQQDRLINLSSPMFQQAPADDSTPADADVLDEVRNPLAQQFDNMMNTSNQQHKEQLMRQLNNPNPVSAGSTNDWFINQPTQSNPSIAPSRSISLPQAPISPILPVSSVQPIVQPILNQTLQPKKTDTVGPGILKLANNNDLNVETLAREAQREQQEQADQDEVVISLH